jgi:hypothetical protein
MKTNHASGGVRRRAARIHGRRHSAAEMRAPAPLGADVSIVPLATTG